MRELVRDKGRLEDIVEYSSNVLKIIDGIELEEFSSNILVYFATMKNVEIVGEAAYMLTKEFKASHPEIPWKQVEGMRHVLVHGYSQVLPRILWATAKENIPEIKAQVEKYLNETILVFANRFISATCVLNGRKAYSCVMRMGKKINI